MSRVAVTREMPPDRVAVRIADPNTGATIARHAEDEARAENVATGIRKTGEMPGGHKELSYSLARDPRRDYPDLAPYLDVFLEQPGGETLWEGRIDKTSESDGDRQAIDVQCVGHQAALEDRKGIVAGFIDRDLSKWGNAPTPRITSLGSAYKFNEGSTEVKTGESGAAALVLAFSRLANGFPPTGIVEAWYDSQGIEIGEVLYEVANYDLGSGGYGHMAAPWAINAQLAKDEQASEVNATPNLLGSSPQRGSIAATGSRRYAFVQLLLALAFTGDGDWRAEFLQLFALANHGLSLQGEWPNMGFTSGQMLRHAVPLFSYLEATEESVEDTGYVIPQAWFSDPGTLAAIVKDLGKYELLDWFVMNGKLFEQRIPGTYGRKWQAYAGPSELKDSGIDGSQLYRDIKVSWQDVSGRTLTAGSLGSGAMVEDARLEITDPDHPAVRAGIPREEILALRGISTQERAIEAGERWIKDANELTHSGEATLYGYVMDDKGVMRPVGQVQPGDYIRFPDARDADYRKIVVPDYGHDDKKCTVALDAPSNATEALLERYNAALVRIGLL